LRDLGANVLTNPVSFFPPPDEPAPGRPAALAITAGDVVADERQDVLEAIEEAGELLLARDQVVDQERQERAAYARSLAGV
jgi:hypothetical protein